MKDNNRLRFMEKQIKMNLLRIFFGIYNKLKWKFFLFKHRLPMVLERGAWSMDTQDFEVILRSIKCILQKAGGESITILELGSGVSTLIFACELSMFSSQSIIISVEAEREIAAIIQNLIDGHNLHQTAKVYHIEYKSYNDYLWFNQERMRTLLDNVQKKIDVLVVDAPPDILCPYSRKPAIPFLLRYLKDECIVFLHDAKRNDESYITQEWSRYFKGLYVAGTPLGLAVFRGKNET